MGEPQRPLEGIRLLDLTRVMSGPFASAMLSDLGAEVTKVESSGGGDILRHIGGHSRGGSNAIFLSLNRGKRSLSLDFRSPGATAALADMAASADVFLENFRPGVCDAMGLGHEVLRARNPRLVYVSISGFGPDSPARDEPAYDTIIQGRTGIVARQRRGERGKPDLVRSYVADKAAGFFATQAVLAALYARERTGDGAYVSVPMFDAALYYAWSDGMTDQTYLGDDVRPGTLFPLSQTLTQSSDGFLTHLALSDRERAGVARAVGRADLNEDPRFATAGSWSRPENLSVWATAVREGFAVMTTEEAILRLRAEDVPCSPVAEACDVLADEHVRGADVFDVWTDARAGEVRQPRLPVRFDNVAIPVGHTVPARGDHSVEVLRAYGIDDDRIAALIAAGSVEQSSLEQSLVG